MRLRYTQAPLDWPDDTYKTLPCRPTIACTAEVVRPGAFELEAGWLFRRLDANAAGRQWSFPFLAKLTLLEGVQLQAGSNGYSAARGDVPAQYLDDATFGLKVLLTKQGDLVPAMPAIAFSATASIPTLAGRGYLRTYDALLTAYVTRDLGPLHADWNVGFNVWRLEDRPLPQTFTALAVSMNLPSPFGVMAEAYVFSDAAPVATRDGGFLFALSHSPRAWLAFDAGGDVGFFPSIRAYSVFVGMSVIPAVLWRDHP